MKLKTAQVFNYKCIKDSNKVEFEDVTCLVGKNESGKTAFLQALGKINPSEISPLYEDRTFNPTRDFPRATYYREYKKKKQEDNKLYSKVIVAEFELEKEEIYTLETKYGKGILKSSNITVSKYYEDDTMEVRYDEDEKKAVDFLVKEEAPEEIQDDLKGCSDLEALESKIDELIEQETGSNKEHKLKTFKLSIESKCPKGVRLMLIADISIPKFFYFDDYNIMNGTVYINRLKGNEEHLTSKEKTFKKFLEFAGIKLDELKGVENYEDLIASLEAMSNEITSQIFEYWTQNKNLSVVIEKTERYPKDEHYGVGGSVIRVRIKNEKHKVTVPFDERSKGFIWFFSFLIYFSEIEKEKEKVILLLDEPGLSLHAKAQGDLLRFINEKLAVKHQVIYSTHSPFLIPSDAWDSVRTVEDMEDEGTKISADALKNSKDTVFPLQEALGYDIAQSLFVGKNCLIVEGPSDLIYLQVISNFLDDKGKTSLDKRWVVTPVGGADNIPTFISLLKANNLNLVVLRDFAKKDRQKIENLTKNGFLKEKNIILLSEYNDGKESDIEDLFSEDFYTKIINDCYKDKLNKEVKISDLPRDPRIVKRFGKVFKGKKGLIDGKFNHYKPAMYLQSNFDKYKDEIEDDTLDKFEDIFKRVNKLCSSK